jgi:hypothetical protein
LKKKLQIALLGMLLKNSKSLEDLVFHSPIIIDFMIEAMGGARVNYCLSTDTAKNFLALAATEKGQKILTHEVPFLTSDFVLNLTYREFLKELGFSVSPKTSLGEISEIFGRETFLKMETDREFKFHKGESFLNAVRLSLDHEKMRTALLGGTGRSKDLLCHFIPTFREGFEALIQAAKKCPEIKAHLAPALEKYFSRSTIVHSAAQSSPSGLRSLIQWAKEDPDIKQVFVTTLAIKDLLKSTPVHLSADLSPAGFQALIEWAKEDPDIKKVFLMTLTMQDHEKCTPIHIAVEYSPAAFQTLIEWAKEDFDIKAELVKALEMQRYGDQRVPVHLAAGFSDSAFEALVKWAKEDIQIKAQFVRTLLMECSDGWTFMHTLVARRSFAGQALIQWAEEDPEFRAVFINILQSTFKSSKRNAERDNLNRSVLIQLMTLLPSSVERGRFLKDLEDGAKHQGKEAFLNIRRLITEKGPESGQSILDFLNLDQQCEIAASASVPAGVFAGAFATSSGLSVSRVEESKGEKPEGFSEKTGPA